MAIQKQVPTPQTVRKIAEAHQAQNIDRVVDVPVDKEPGDAEDSGSCCKIGYGDVKASIDIHPDSVVMIAVHAQTIENPVDENDSTECAFVDSDTRCGWLQSLPDPRLQTSWSVWARRTVVSETS